MKTIKKAGLVGAAVLALSVGYTAFAQQKEEAPLEEQQQEVPQEEAAQEEVSQELSDYVEQYINADVQAGARSITQVAEPYQAIKNKEYEKALQILGGYLSTTKEGFLKYKEQLSEAPLTDEARERVNALVDEQIKTIDDLLSEQK